MSPEVIAALLGVLVGVLAERIARSLGRLWIDPDPAAWELQFFTLEDYGLGEELSLEEIPEQAGAFKYRFGVDLYNGKEIPVGLRKVSIVFLRDGRQVGPYRPIDLATATEKRGYVFGGQSHYYTDHDPAYVINIPPRQYVHKELEGSVAILEAAKAVAVADRAEFVCEQRRSWPFGPKTHRKTLATRQGGVLCPPESR